MSLLSRLFLLVAVALLPAIAIQIYNEIDLRHARQAEVSDQALSLATLAAAEQQQMVQGIRQVLIAMSELPSIKARNSDACNAYLAAIRQRFGLRHGGHQRQRGGGERLHGTIFFSARSARWW